MRIIGIMLVKNEDWVLRCSLDAAAQWCDRVVVVDHCSWDASYDIIKEVAKDYPFKIHYSRWEPTRAVEAVSRYDAEGKPLAYGAQGEKFSYQEPDPDKQDVWDEMDMRQHSLLLARKHGATHVAIVDADEVVTANLKPKLRQMLNGLQPGECLDLPMLSMRGLDRYQSDNSVWSNGVITLGFADKPNLTWKPSVDGYHHHHRKPHGAGRTTMPMVDGGIMHLQFANERRLLAKHVLYRMVDHLRWPERDDVAQLNVKYDQALQWPKANAEQIKRVKMVPEDWWQPYNKAGMELNGVPWQEMEVKRLLALHGKDAFVGLDLKGLDK